MLFIIALTLVSALAASAQDRIYFNDSRIVDAVVDEVTDNYIYYRLYGNPRGPVCSTATYNVFKIVYSNGQVQTFSEGHHYDERLLLDENMRTLLDGQPVRMGFDSGQLYLGSRSRYGAMQADYIAFNLYGEEYQKARNSRIWGYGFVWAGSLLALSGLAMISTSSIEMEMITTDFTAVGAATTLVGAACLGAGIPLVVMGNKKLRGIADDYNSRYADGKSAELTFGPCPSGIGFALNF